MNKPIQILLLSLLILPLMLGCGCAVSASAAADSLPACEILYADPTVFTYGDRYYLSGTRNSDPAGFVLLQSDDLLNWSAAEPDSVILRRGAGSFGDKGFWAPQLLKDDHDFVLTYTANEQTVVARADSLTGPFSQTVVEPVDGSEKNIDSYLFRDDDGKWYLYHVRFDHGNFLWVAEFDPSAGHILPETLTPLFRNDQAWESTPAYESDPVMEGPTVVKLDGKYYLFYSANHFQSPDYAVGYAVADSPMGPWVKNPANPIIHRNIVGENGAGHGDFFVDHDGNCRYVYHVHNSGSEVSPRRTRIITLKLRKDTDTGVYNITADPSTIIRPLKK